LNTKVIDAEFSSLQPRDHILFQEPGPGAEIKISRDVRIIVSKGPKGIIVPPLKDLVYQEAATILENQALCVGQSSYTYSDSWQKDRIIAHIPPAGTDLDQGECVSLLVSKGRRPATILMPDLRGLTPDDAITEIDLNNLVLGDISNRYQADMPIDTILDQRPFSGHRVEEGMTVQLVRNQSSDRAVAYRGKPENPYRLLRYRSESGFINKRIRIHLIAFGLSIDIFDSFIGPGEEVWWIVPGKPYAKVVLHVDGNRVLQPLGGLWQLSSLLKIPTIGE